MYIIYSNIYFNKISEQRKIVSIIPQMTVYDQIGPIVIWDGTLFSAF